MRVSCDSCGAPVPAADVNIQQLVAKCVRCDSVFSLGDRLAHGPRAPRRRPPLPRGLTIESGEPALPDEGGYRRAPASDRGPLVISRRWFRPRHVFLAFFAIPWNGFLVVWYTLGVSSGAPLAMFLFPIIHVAAGVGMAYAALTGLFNRTTLRVDSGILSVRHGPLPWIGNVTIEAARLRQLYLRCRAHRTRGRGSYTTWSVQAETHAMESVTLLSRLHDHEQAAYVEWAVEEHLGIEDDPSYGHAPGA